MVDPFGSGPINGYPNGSLRWKDCGILVWVILPEDLNPVYVMLVWVRARFITLTLKRL